MSTEDEQKSVQNYWCNHLYYPIIDSIINHLKQRFSEESQELALAADSFLNLDYKEALPFINHYEVFF